MPRYTKADHTIDTSDKREGVRLVAAGYVLAGETGPHVRVEVKKADEKKADEK